MRDPLAWCKSVINAGGTGTGECGCELEPAVEGTEPRRLRLGARLFTLGRDTVCDGGLADGAVSGRHLELRVRGDALIAEDLDSRTGTWRGEERLT